MTSVPEFDTFLRSIIETLERLGLPYMIGGSVASSIYGEARSTRDVDVSVVIVYKLKYYLEGRMPKHLRDIGAMLFVQGEALDYNYIAEWAEWIGAADVWAEILAEYRQRC